MPPRPHVYFHSPPLVLICYSLSTWSPIGSSGKPGMNISPVCKGNMIDSNCAGSSANTGFKDGFHPIILACFTPKAIMAPSKRPIVPHRPSSGFRTVHTADSLDPSAPPPHFSRSRIYSSCTMPSRRRLHLHAGRLAHLPSSKTRPTLQQTTGAIFALSQYMFHHYSDLPVG